MTPRKLLESGTHAMSHLIPGLHHVTAISGPPQANVGFYIGALRQHLVKKTVNFDAPDTYHLYYGDTQAGLYPHILPVINGAPGRAGPGMASAVAYMEYRWADWAPG